MEKEQILLEIKKTMEKHKGKQNAISSGKIGEMLNLKQEDTHVEARMYIYKVMKKYRIPIAGGGRGYYIIKNQEELKQYTTTLDNRSKKIIKRKKEVEAIFKEVCDE